MNRIQSSAALFGWNTEASRRIASLGKNDAQPTSMIKPNVHIPRHSPMPTCSSDRAGQHKRPPERLPDQDAERDFPDDRHVRHDVDEPRVPCQPGHVERLILEVGERPPHRLTAPPRRPLQLRETREQIDHTHVNLN